MNSTASNWRMRFESMLNVKTLHEVDEDHRVPSPLVREPVLIIDDDADWGNECAFSLQVLGYQPFLALNAETAVELLLTYGIATAIVDYNMPGQDGIALIEELSRAAEAEGRRVNFIMATGYATKDVAIGAMRASVADFLEKPIHHSDLEKAMQRIKGLQEGPAAREALLDKMSSLSVELQRLSHLIGFSNLSGQDLPGAASPAMESETQPSDPPQGAEYDKAELAGFIRELLRKETKRRSIGGGLLFGDPAWEMLLDLLLARLEDRRVSVSSACIASGAPMSTALRLVRRLDAEGVLIKIPDEKDRRRHFLVINPDVEQPLLDHLSEQLRQKSTR